MRTSFGMSADRSDAAFAGMQRQGRRFRRADGRRRREQSGAGGIGGNEGAHYWAVDGEEAGVKALVDFLEQNIKGEPPVKGNKGNCANCRYPVCKYNGLKPEELPAWMKKRGIER